MDTSFLYWEMLASFMLHLAGPLAIAAMFASVMKGYSAMTRVYIIILGSVIWSFIVNFGVLTVLQTTSCGGLQDFKGVAIGAAISAILTAFFMWVPSIWEGLRLAISQVFVPHQPLQTPADAARENGLIKASVQVFVPQLPTAIPVRAPGQWFPGPAGPAGPGQAPPASAEGPTPPAAASSPEVNANLNPKNDEELPSPPLAKIDYRGLSQEERARKYWSSLSPTELARHRADSVNIKHIADDGTITLRRQRGGGRRLTPEEYQDQLFGEIKSALAYMSAFAGAYGVGIGSRYAVTCKKA